MEDNMFQPSCGYHQVSQVEIQSHMRITHLYGIPLVLHLLILKTALELRPTGNTRLQSCSTSPPHTTTPYLYCMSEDFWYLPSSFHLHCYQSHWSLPNNTGNWTHIPYYLQLTQELCRNIETLIYGLGLTLHSGSYKDHTNHFHRITYKVLFSQYVLRLNFIWFYLCPLFYIASFKYK